MGMLTVLAMGPTRVRQGVALTLHESNFQMSALLVNFNVPVVSVSSRSITVTGTLCYNL